MDPIKDFDNILNSFKIKALCASYNSIGNYFYYDIKLLPGGRVKDIQKYSDEISLALKSGCKPIIKIMHSTGVVRMEFALPSNASLKLFNYFPDSAPNGDLNCLLGQSVEGEEIWMDLSKNPHMIVSGTTGSGKSVLLHNIIANLLKYSDAQMYLVDSKRIEFCEYDGAFKNIEVSYSYEETLSLSNSLLKLMEYRYDLLKVGHSLSEFKPIVVIIDEFADLIMQDKEEQFYISLCRLAQKCRSAKIYFILATQRPSVNIISGAIKANFPARIACKVASHVDSKVILDVSGAQNLLGKGDAIIKDNFRSFDRFQVAYTDATEVCSYFRK